MQTTPDTDVNKGEFISLVSIVVMIVALCAGVIVLYYQNATFESRRALCNRQYNTQPELEENNGPQVFYFTGSTTVDQVQRELNQTNKKVNKLSTLIGCYFDKFE